MTRRTRLIAGIVLVLYVVIYVGLSRRGYAEAREWDAPGFYYLSPENTRQWQMLNRTCCCVFAPLNYVDCLLGFGMGPASDPLWHLS